LRPTNLYFDRLDEIEIDLSLKKLHCTAETEDQAAATKARMDLEASASPELVRDLRRQLAPQIFAPQKQALEDKILQQATPLRKPT